LIMSWKTTEQAGLRLARQEATRAHKSNGLRVDLFQLADRLGIDRIEEQDIPTTALLVARLDDHYTVFLQRGTSVPRQRFSMAHEIAHVLLKPLLGGQIQHWARLDPSQDPHGRRIERLCDQMAATILMPKETFSTWMASKRWSAFALPEACKEFSVSLEACARRFVDLVPTPSALVRWRLGENRCIAFTKRPLATKIKNLLSLEFVTEDGRASSSMLESFTKVVPTKSSEMVRFYIGRSIRPAKASVESLCHGRGQWREVYSFVYPEQRSGAGGEEKTPGASQDKR